MSTKPQTALDKFASGYNCAQSVLWAFHDEFAVDENLLLKLATGLGAGMARKQEVCGAVTGGILVLGLRYGRSGQQDRSAAEQTYRYTRLFMEQFAAKHGSCICRELLHGTDLATDEGQRRFKDKALLNNVCKPCVQAAVELLESAPFRGEAISS